LDYEAEVKKHGSGRKAALALKIPDTTFRYHLKKQRTKSALSGLGLETKDAEAAVIDNLDLSGTSRYYKLEDGGVWVKTDKTKIDLTKAIRDIIEAASSDTPAIPEIKPLKDYIKNLCAVLPIGDAHIGMWACKDRSGAAWDLNIAKTEMCGAFKYLIDRSPACEKIIIMNVGDWFHYSKMVPTTEGHGHVLSVDGSPMSMYSVGVDIMEFAIEYAATKYQEVEVQNVAGNHDGLLAYAMSDGLNRRYRDNPRITVRMDHTRRIYTRFGKNLFGLVHGHQTKDSNLIVTMAQEVAEYWGQTLHRVFFRGHDHHKNMVDYVGGTVEHVRTWAPGDDYSSDNGYISQRSLDLILYHREYGRQGHGDSCTPEMIREMLI